MVDNIYKKLLEKHTLEELKDRIPAEKSLERIVLPSSTSSASKSPLPLADSPKGGFSWETYGGPIVLVAVIGISFGIAHIVKRDSTYEFNAYIGKEKVHFYETALLNTDRIEVEKENGIRIIYSSGLNNDNKITEVASVVSGKETILCDEGSCLEEATKIALEYKQKILETKGLNEALKK